jgi:hypothetical protein
VTAAGKTGIGGGGSGVEQPFSVEPNQQQEKEGGGALNFREHQEPGPTLRCGLSPPFRNRSRYELEWLQVAEHTPILVARNGRLYGKAMGAYELM